MHFGLPTKGSIIEVQLGSKYASVNITLNLTFFGTHFTESQGSKFASALSKCWGFCRGISMFFSICCGKKNAEAIKCLVILKEYVTYNKMYFYFKKKRNVLPNKKVIFVFHTIFKLDFITQIIYCTIHR